MSAKLAALGFLKIKVFRNKSYDVKICVHDVTYKILSYASNGTVDLFMWPKFGNPSMFIREVIITSILTRKPNFFEGYSWFRFYNLGLALGIVLKYLQQCGKRVKTKLQKVFEASSYVCRNYRRKTGRGPFCTSPPSPILNRAKFIPKLSLIKKFIYFWYQ